MKKYTSKKNKDLKTEISGNLKNIDVFWDDCIQRDPMKSNEILKLSKVNNNNIYQNK